MGEKDVKSSAGTIGEAQPIGEPETGKNGSAGNKNSDSTGNTSDNRGRKRGRAKAGSTEGKQSEATSEVLDLNLPAVNIPNTEEKPKRGRKPKKIKEESESFNAEQFTALIVSISAMISAREGMQHWMISEAEAQQIAKPLSNIIAKSESLKSLGEHADAFALVSACIMIFAPRLIITLQMKKKKKGDQKNVNTTVKDTKSNSGNRAPEKNKDTTPISTNVKSFLDEISLGY